MYIFGLVNNKNQRRDHEFGKEDGEGLETERREQD